jgi:LmbE family N-acetylglucosaminyl deacetylase
MHNSLRFGKVNSMLHSLTRLVTVLMLTLPTFVFSSPTLAQPARQPHSGELQAAIQRLGVVGSVLYVAAHPDDENSRLLAYLVGERGLTATYLSLTRGDGGQNLIGTEQDELLGLLRTHELLAARRIDGAEQLFTRARDLGYTKRADEAFAIWGHDAVLGDVVQAIRRTRADVVITRFNTLPPNHGHHTASALLAAEAFAVAGDAKQFPEQLQMFPTWQPARLLYNASTWNLPPNPDMSAYLKLDVGGYDPLRGKSWPEIAAESRSQHKSQGFGVTAERGPSLEYFSWLAGSKPLKDPLEGLDFTWKRYPGGEKLHKAVAAAVNAFVPAHPEKAIPALWQVQALLLALPDENPWKIRKLHETEAALLACAGVVLDVRTDEATARPGGEVKLQLVALNRAHTQAKLLDVTLPDGVTVANAELKPNQPQNLTHTLKIAENTPISTPYWLRVPAEGGLDVVADLALRGLPVGPPALQATFKLELGGHTLQVVRTARYVWNDAVKGEQSRLFEVAPQTLVPTQPAVRMVVNGQPRPLVAEGWTEQSLQYDHVPPLTLRRPLRVKDVPLTLNLAVKKIAYVPGPGDRVAESLRAVGYDVTLLPLDKLVAQKLDGLEAILVGVRAFNQPKQETEALRLGQRHLLEYVAQGGKLIVQYQTNTKLAPLHVDVGPYPLEVGRERVTDQDAEMTPLDPHDPLLQTPNQLTAADFAGWVQERGLYFAQKWDAKYRAVFAMHDKDEAPLQGGLLVAKYGKGTFVYTGLAFFRQLPAGVPGAYRLLANLMAL